METEDAAAAWREGFDYRITIDRAASRFDPEGRLSLRGMLANLGRDAIDFSDDPRGIVRIGARTRTGLEEIHYGEEARAIPSTRVLAPGSSAPFRLRLPLRTADDAPCDVQLSLVCEGHFWFCDVGFPSLTIATDASGARDSTVQVPSLSNGSSIAAPDAASQIPVAESTDMIANTDTGSLNAYYKARLGAGATATLDDLWNCYRLLLDRVPDAGGFEQYTDSVRGGIAVRDLVDMFVASEEFAYRLSRPKTMETTRTRIGGLDLYMPTPQTAVERQTLSSGHTRPHLAGAMSSVLATNQFVVDVGAGFGEFTTLAARRVGAKGRVVALEPNPRLTRLLLANITQCGFANVDVLPFCAADGDGFVTLARRGAITIARDVSQDDLTSDADVQVVYARTLDSIIPSDQRVDVLKIALDGYDHRAMSGAKQLLSRWRPHLFGDYAPGLLHEFSGIEPQDYLKFLRGCGYDHFTAISPDYGPIEIGDDIAKLADMPARLGTASVDFYAVAR